MAGDTTVVRTLAGSEWAAPGEWRETLSIGQLDGPEELSFGRLRSLAIHRDGRILAVDTQVPTVRVFGADGAYLDSWGREGQGPGELGGPDSGLAVLPDGRVVVRDWGNARLQVFSPDGTPEDTWPVITGQYINRRAFATSGDTLLNPDVVNPGDPLDEWRLGMVRIASDGSVIDTLPVPDATVRPHRFVARSGGNASESDLPFAPAHHWAWHPDGFFVHGSGNAYSLTLDRDGEPLRVEREAAPVPVSQSERAQERERVVKAMRWLDRSWRWDGPEIPDTKPFFSRILIGAAGRIWVLREMEAYERHDPDFNPTDPFDTEIRWLPERTLDAFLPDGTFLGTVRLPRELDWRVPPVLKADTMWAVSRDELGVQRIRRYEIEFPPGEAARGADPES